MPRPGAVIHPGSGHGIVRPRTGFYSHSPGYRNSPGRRMRRPYNRCNYRRSL
ncbi:MAG: hypothetical protein SV239_08860 [Thermodesulfobacteriota bacterium]|nr:hypothetical protein [Thermodesulfobacteriota bacterium]